MESKKSQGFIFPIQDKSGNSISNIFLQLESLDKGEKFSNMLSEANEILYEIFPRSEHRIEIRPAFDFENLESKYFAIAPVTFPIDLFVDSSGNFNSNLFKEIIMDIKAGKIPYFPDIIAGAVVRSKDFYNYEEFIAKIWEILEDKNLILTAPRRFGKTSILYNLLDNPKENYCPVLIDLEGISECPSFIAEIITAMRRKEWLNKCSVVCEIIGNSFTIEESEQEQEIFNYKENLKLEIKDNWAEKWEEIMEGFNQGNLKILFPLDEFSYMLENFIKRGDNDSQKLVEIIHKTTKLSNNVRFILTGSILLKRIFDEIDYQEKEEFYLLFPEKKLPFLKKEKAFEFVQILFAKIGTIPEKEIVEGILNIVGKPVPYFI